MALMGLTFTSCEDVLNETPRASFTPEYFKTEAGVKAGMTALYANLRNVYGQAYYWNSCETGTDEYTYGESGHDENFMVLDMTPESAILKSTNCRADVLWGSAFPDINTANGVIENGEAAGIDAALLAEAHFFRAFDYFQLVQTYGGVPLDLGAGELKFNTSTIRGSVRNTVVDVYEKAIFPDLEKAMEELPTTPRLTGTVTKTTAALVLAKAYLTYAWWLQNPNNIPTYPECTRDASKAAGYFQKAYNTAVNAIKNPGPYGLCETFMDIHYGPNDRNKEILLYADHTAQDELFNGGVGYGYGNGGAPDNFVNWIAHWNYPTMNGGVLVRDARQSYGRPWTRMATPMEVPLKFTDKNIDYRYEGTFVTAFRGNWHHGGDKAATKTNANGLSVKPNDIVLMFQGENQAENLPDDKKIKYPAENEGGGSGLGAGTLDGESYYVMTPDHLSRRVYLNIWKCGYYNEKTVADETSVGMPNGATPRPFNILRFAELYFVAAEAAVKGATTEAGYTARELMQVIRGRAGKWRLAPYAYKDYGVDLSEGKLYADHSQEMKDATPQDITIDYILDERFREFYGEGLRWFDLVRTQEWEQMAKTYHICGDGVGSAQQTKTRTIEKHHYLRPIPVGQLDALQMTKEEKQAYQNPGYRE